MFFTKIRSLIRFPKNEVPIVRQLTVSECGAACLCMIMGYFGHKISLFECRKEMGNGRSGISAFAIKQAARKFGFKLEAYAVEHTNLQFINLPAIIHWRFNHFVVLEKYSDETIQISDPAIGRYLVKNEEFRQNFTGVVMVLERSIKTMTDLGKRFSLQGYKYISVYLKNQLGLISQIILTSIIIQFLGIVIPLSTKIAVDSIIPLASVSVLTVFALSMIMLLTGQIASNYLRAINLSYLQIRMDSGMMFDLFKHLLSLPLSFFHQRSSGDLIMRMGSISTIRDTLTGQTLSIFLDGTLAIFYLIIIFCLSPVFGMAALIIGSVQVGIYLASTKKMQRLIQAEIFAQSESQSYIVEALSRITFLKASGKESAIDAEWSNYLTKQLGTSLEKSQFAIILETTASTIKILSPSILLWIGIYLVIEQTISLGSMLALNAFVLAFLNPIANFVASIQRLQLINTHLERIEDIFETVPEQNIKAVKNPPLLSGKIEVKDLNFSYSAEAETTLKNINLLIKPGQKVAIVGETGSGKSTLGKLLLGLYPLTEGEIIYDETSISDYDYQKLRQQIGVVLQEPFLFSGSIRKNISFGNPECNFDEIIKAAKKACIHDEIMKMPMGYETLIAEGNGGLSGGQSQRIALARAILSNPPILLLDEATSHLDVVTEAKVDAFLSEMKCTRIVIAHRLSTIINSDVIYVLSGGSIVESGTHPELLQASGHYSKLVKSQMKTLNLLKNNSN